MNKKGKTSLIVIAIIIAIAVLLFFLYTGDKIPARGEIINGWWNAQQQECWYSSGGLSPPAGQIQVTMFQCCFDFEGYQVDCNDATDRVGPHKDKGHSVWTGGNGFAIYGEDQPTAGAGFFSIAHTITISETGGNVDLTNVWVDSAVWTGGDAAQRAVIDAAYSQVIGAGSSYAGKIDLGGAPKSFPTGLIDLQAIGGEAGAGITYSLSLTAKASATGLPDSPDVIPATMYVEKEAIGFSVQINIGA